MGKTVAQLKAEFLKQAGFTHTETREEVYIERCAASDDPSFQSPYEYHEPTAYEEKEATRTVSDTVVDDMPDADLHTVLQLQQYKIMSAMQRELQSLRTELNTLRGQAEAAQKKRDHDMQLLRRTLVVIAGFMAVLLFRIF